MPDHPLGGRVRLLVMTMMGGGTDARRASVDATCTRDPELKHECGATEWAIAHSLGIARTGGRNSRSPGSGGAWQATADDAERRVLEAMLYAGPGVQRGSRRKAEPDCHAHHELRRPGVTLMLLLEEYRRRGAGRLRLQPLV
jgi:hypothetical protein